MNKMILSIVSGIGALGILGLVFIYTSQGGSNAPLNEQLTTFLQEYVRINTSQPNPDYEKALTFLKKHAQADGFVTQEIILPSKKKVLVITFQGTDSSLPSLALNHHIDVVPANEAGWNKPPFAAEIVDGVMIGRGTQDMKGIGAIHYFAIKQLKQEGFLPRRTIHIFAVPDEEIGGFTGTKQFLETPFFKQLNIKFIIDEGHASGDQNYLDIKVSERKPIQVSITSKGEMAHGSRLDCKNAIHELVQFLNIIVGMHEEQQKQISTKQPGLLLSCNITSLSAGVQNEKGHVTLNIVPDLAETTIDIRVPPTMKKREVLHMLEQAIRKYPQLKYTILAQAEEEPAFDDQRTELYQALSKAIAKYNLRTRPHYFEASSDLRFYLARGIDGVGFTPFTITDNIHGINESVPVNQLIRGKDITMQFIRDFCG